MTRHAPDEAGIGATLVSILTAIDALAWASTTQIVVVADRCRADLAELGEGR